MDRERPDQLTEARERQDTHSVHTMTTNDQSYDRNESSTKRLTGRCHGFHNPTYSLECTMLFDAHL